MCKFKQGESGNPLGRPKGIKDKRTALNKLLEPRAEALVTKAVEMALGGDITALRLCIERLIPRARTCVSVAGDFALSLNDIEDVKALSANNANVIKAFVGGELDFEQAQAIANLFEIQHKFIVGAELEQRLAAIEQVLKIKKERQKE